MVSPLSPNIRQNGQVPINTANPPANNNSSNNGNSNNNRGLAGGEGSGSNPNQGNWSSPPHGGTLNYTANQSISANNVTNEWQQNYGNRAPNQQPRTAQEAAFLSSSPMPENWCSILYFELGNKRFSSFSMRKKTQKSFDSRYSSWRNVQNSSRLEVSDCRRLRGSFWRKSILLRSS